MDNRETARLLSIIRDGLDKRGWKVARTSEQINDINQRNVESAWAVLGGQPPKVIEFPKGDAANEHVVGCFPIIVGERVVLPDNKIGHCAWGCGRAIQYRPYIPDHVVKVCLYCVAERVERGDQ